MGAPKLDQNNPLLDKRIINAFIDGVVKTLSTMAQTKVVIGKPTIETEFQSRGDIAGLIGMVAGPIKGSMTISFKKEGLFFIIQNMLGETYTELNKDSADAVGELTNMIYGTAKTTLNQTGYAFEMAIPTIIQGNFKISNIHIQVLKKLIGLTPQNSLIKKVNFESIDIISVDKNEWVMSFKGIDQVWGLP